MREKHLSQESWENTGEELNTFATSAAKQQWALHQ
jgi:hypothetical protein